MAKEMGQRPNHVREWDEDEVLGVVAYAGLQAPESRPTPSGRRPSAGAVTTTTVHKLKQRKRE